jgi:lysophospholipase L1-like esterase
LIKNAFIQSRHLPGVVNLGLQRLNLQIWWQGRGGMVVNRLPDQIHTMLGFEDPPKFFILHVGGNDLGYKKVSLEK